MMKSAPQDRIDSSAALSRSVPRDKRGLGRRLGRGLTGSVLSLLRGSSPVPSVTKEKDQQKKERSSDNQQDKTPGRAEGSNLALGLKRWLVPLRFRRTASKTKIPPVSPHPPWPGAGIIPSPPRNPEPRSTSDLALEELYESLHEFSNIHNGPGKKNHSALDDFIEDDVPVPSELFDFPPPPPHIRNETDAALNTKREPRRFRSEERHGRIGNKEQPRTRNTFPRRSRSILNERTFVVTPRYSSPQLPSVFRPPAPHTQNHSSTSIERPSMAHSPAFPSPKTLHSSFEELKTRIQPRPKSSRLSKPLPLPPDWTFDPESGLPTPYNPTTKLYELPSDYNIFDVIRSSRAARRRYRTQAGMSNTQINEPGFNAKPRHSHHNPHSHFYRPPSPRPTSSRDRSIHYSRRSSSLCSSHRNNTDPRTGSRSSLGSIVGGHSSDDTDDSVSFNAPSGYFDGINVVDRSTTSGIFCPYPPPPSASSRPDLLASNEPDGGPCMSLVVSLDPDLLPKHSCTSLGLQGVDSGCVYAPLSAVVDVDVVS